MKNEIYRKFCPNTPIHVYLQSFDSGVLFYDELLILEHWMIFSVCATRYHIKVMAHTYMITHTHSTIVAASKKDFDSFHRDYKAWFSRVYNLCMNKTGPVFSKRFDYALKSSPKAVRTNLNYVANNGPEKKLSARAYDYKYNFLKYGEDSHPFSDPISQDLASDLLRIGLERVKRSRQQNYVVDLMSLLKFRTELSDREWRQFSDFLISEYNVIDYELSSSYFGGYDNMIMAPECNSGSEYDIKESFGGNTYLPYIQMMDMVFCKERIWSPFILDDRRIKEMTDTFLRKGINIHSVERFFHI